MPGVEKTVQQLIEAGKNGKTINLNVGILKAFCNWCIERDYLADNQLKKVKPVQEEAAFRRRAVTMEELRRIVGVVTANKDLFGYWQILLSMACCVGIRSNAIRNLTIEDLNLEKCQLRLQAKSAKNRKESFKAISQELAGLVLIITTAVRSSGFIIDITPATMLPSCRQRVRLCMFRATRRGNLIKS